MPKRGKVGFGYPAAVTKNPMYNRTAILSGRIPFSFPFLSGDFPNRDWSRTTAEIPAIGSAYPSPRFKSIRLVPDIVSSLFKNRADLVTDGTKTRPPTGTTKIWSFQRWILIMTGTLLCVRNGVVAAVGVEPTTLRI
jgi:hypothetical protein